MQKILAYARKTNLISVVSLKENRGVAYARNEGIINCHEEFIALLDADDMMTPQSVEWRLHAFEKNPRLDVVHGRARKCHDDVSYKWCLKHWQELELYTRPPEYKAINFQTVMYRRKVFNEFGLFYEKLKSREDKEWTSRLGLHRESPYKPLVKAERIEKDIAFYRRHPQSKHKRRIADPVWSKETDRIFEERMKELKREGITRENTRFI